MTDHENEKLQSIGSAVMIPTEIDDNGMVWYTEFPLDDGMTNDEKRAEADRLMSLHAVKFDENPSDDGNATKS